MPLRLYKPDDSLALATIKAACDLTDPLALYCRHLNPSTSQHQQPPDKECKKTNDDKQWKAYIKSLQRSFELEILLPGTVCWIVYELNQSAVDDANDGEEKVIGFAIWNCHGHSDIARKWRGNGSRVSTRVKSIMSYISMTITYPFDSSIDHNHMAQFQHRIRSAPSPLPSGQKLKVPKERWELEALYIAPEYQRRGYGMEALSWGLGIAKEENVDVWVWSSDAGKVLYEKAGFEVLGRIGFGDLLSDITDHTDGREGNEVAVWIMVWRDRKN